MQFDVEIPLEATPEGVLAALSSENFVEYSTAELGATLTHATVTTTPEGDVTLSVRRTVPTSLIPQQARGLVGNNVEIRQVEAWSRPHEGVAGPRYGTVAAEVVGAPAQVTGTVSVQPTSAGSQLVYSLQVRCVVPIVGAMVERAVAEGIRSALSGLGAALQDWIANPENS